MSYCPKCGKRIDGDYNYCPSCGASLNKAQESSATVFHTGNTTNIKTNNNGYKKIFFVLPLLSVIVEFMLVVISNVILEMSYEFAWTVIITFILCGVVSILSLVFNIIFMKRGIKGKAIGGLVLSIVSISITVVFAVSCLYTLWIYQLLG